MFFLGGRNVVDCIMLSNDYSIVIMCCVTSLPICISSPIFINARIVSLVVVPDLSV